MGVEVPRLILDVETRSEADLSVVGTWNYSRHPSTRLLCIAVTNEDDNVRCYDARFGQCPKELAIAVRDGWDVFAFNSFFEYCIITHTLPHWPQPKRSQWKDAQFTCLTANRPAKLANAALALGLDQQKDTNGTALINFFCKPVTNGLHKGQFREAADHEERFAELMEYCAQDVRTTQSIIDRLPDPSPSEWAHYRNTMDLNIRGCAIDVPLVESLITMADIAKIQVGEALAAGSDLVAADMNNHRKVLLYANSIGANLESVDKATVKEALGTDLSESVRLVLESRQALGKSDSLLDKFLAQADEQGVVHDYQRANGTQTGRDSGVLLTIQRGTKGLNPEELIDDALDHDDNSFMAVAGRDPMGAITACIRGCLVPRSGEVFHQCDWAAIEPRLGAWGVDDTFVLDDFRRFDAEGGPDLYQTGAAQYYGLSPIEVTGHKRQFGKVYRLLCQYGGAENTLQAQAKAQYGLDLSIEEALKCKEVWRSLHPKWVGMWYSLKDGAVAATKHPGIVIKCGKVAWCHKNGDLRLRLPCGRYVTLADAHMETRDGKYGRREELVYNRCHHNKMIDATLIPGQAFNFMVQGMGASLMRWVNGNLIKAGYSPVLRLHDELVCSVPLDKSFDEYKRIFLTPPPWAPDLPMNGAGWIGPRFKKE